MHDNSIKISTHIHMFIPLFKDQHQIGVKKHFLRLNNRTKIIALMEWLYFVRLNINITDTIPFLCHIIVIFEFENVLYRSIIVYIVRLGGILYHSTISPILYCAHYKTDMIPISNISYLHNVV